MSGLWLGRYGRSDTRAGERVIVEFVSANPTGPLHVGHGRQAALGDAIASLLEWQGCDVTREFYYNDAGAADRRISRCRCSARAQELLGEHGAVSRGRLPRRVHPRARAALPRRSRPRPRRDIEPIRRFAVAELRKEQDLDLQAFGVRFDIYFLECSLYTDGRVDATVERLVGVGHDVREGRRAVAADHRLRRRQGPRDAQVRRRRTRTSCPTSRTTSRSGSAASRASINVQGSDHHSTVTRVRAGLQALGMGIPPGYPDYVLHQMVTVMQGGEEVKISKRAGSYVTVRDLIDEVGRDAVRYFLVIAQGRLAVHVRRRPRALAVRGEPGLLRPVRARARRVGAAPGRHRRRATRPRRRATPTSSPLDQPVRGGAAAPARRLSRRSSRSRRASSRRTSVTFYLKELAAGIPQLL